MNQDLEEIVSELNLDVVDRWSQPSRLDAGMKIDYVMFDVKGKSYCMSYATTGTYCLSNEDDKYFYLGRRKEDLKGAIELVVKL